MASAIKNWPPSSDFQDSLQNPQRAFRDDDLKTVSIQKDKWQMPFGPAGNFAQVYKATYPDGRNTAIRVFARAVPERQERYGLISQYLESRTIKALVRFKYWQDGIRSGGDRKWYPLITMEWINGANLQDWVHARCQTKDRKSLAQMAQRWLEMISELATAQISHGDLQQGNVMVTDKGELKLVDYDCMCVPQLVGRVNLECGLPPYQHPDRTADTLLGMSLDHYSSLFVFVALRALAAAPQLWDTHVVKTEYDKLLIRGEDLDDPDNSALIAELKRSPDAELPRLVQQLIDLRRGPMAAVPRLDQVLFSFTDVEALLNKHDYDQAVEMLSRGKKQLSDAPAALQPRLREAQQRVALRRDLEQAVQAGDEPAMQRLAASALLDNYPAAVPMLAAARKANQVIPVLQSLQAAMQAKKWRDFVRVWDTQQGVLAGRKSAARFETEVNAWRMRNQACDALLALLNQAVVTPSALQTAWDRLRQLGGHPDADSLGPDVQKRGQREEAWQKVPPSAAPISQATDVQIDHAWNEPLFASWQRADQERPRVDAARKRLQLLAQIRQHVAAPTAVRTEEAILQTAGQLPAGYSHEFQARVQTSQNRLSALRQVPGILVEPASDRAIAELWQRLQTVGAAPLVPADKTARFQVAAARAPLIAEVQKVAPNYPIYDAPKCDAVLLAAWRDDLLRDCHDVASWRAAYVAAYERKTLLDQMRSAAAAKDTATLAALGSDPRLEGYPLPTDLGRAAKSAIGQYRAVHQLQTAMDQGDRASFVELFDAELIRGYGEKFASVRTQLCDWLTTDILPASKMGLQSPIARTALSREDSHHRAWRICWQWPATRFASQCLWAICPRMPHPGDTDPTRVATEGRRQKIDRQRYEEGGGSLRINARDEWIGGYVTVWAIVDLGFQVFFSEPLILGRLQPTENNAVPRRTGGFR